MPSGNEATISVTATTSVTRSPPHTDVSIRAQPEVEIKDEIDQDQTGRRAEYRAEKRF